MLMTMLEKQMMAMKMVTQHISTRQNPTVTTLITTDKARHGRNICGGNICGGNIYGGNMLLSHAGDDDDNQASSHGDPIEEDKKMMVMMMMMMMVRTTKQAATVTP